MDKNVRIALRLILLLCTLVAAALAQQQQQEELPVLPPVFIPPNTPQGPPPALQSPIRNLFQGGGDSENSITSFFNRIFRFFG